MVTLARNTGWAKPQKPGAPLPSEVLHAGDLVALAIDAEGVAASVLLLAPARRERQPSKFSVERSRQWADFLQAVRDHFKTGGFIEAQTPTLVPSPGTEPFLDPFSTDWNYGSERTKLYLPTSPEFHLKKMLAQGWTRVFEMKPCFRNGERGEHHQPEFLMLEWYRAYDDLDSIADDVEELLASVGRRFGREIPKLQRTTMAGLFGQAFPGFTLTATTSRDELRSLARANGVETRDSDTWDEVFFRLFLEKIEAGLGQEGPLLVRGYPPSQAALSRIGDDGFADRFEVYWKGLELANAFHELNDPDENRARFADDADKKKALGKDPVPVDEGLLRALDAGLPPSGGIALGVDRLFMALFGIEDIGETRAFPF